MGSFEQKAGKGVALNGLLRNNSELKHEIMQKRTKVDGRCLAMIEKTNKLFQKVDTISAMLQDQSERHARNTTALEFEINKIKNQVESYNHAVNVQNYWYTQQLAEKNT